LKIFNYKKIKNKEIPIEVDDEQKDRKKSSLLKIKNKK